MSGFQNEKELVLNYFDKLEESQNNNIKKIFKKYLSNNYKWYSVYPFRSLSTLDEVLDEFWNPLYNSLNNIERRQDIFIGGKNEIDKRVWIMSMGNFVGLFDNDWLGIRATGKMQHLRYAEFNCVENNQITATGLFIDIIGFMQEAGVNPLPPSTGNYFVYPGPRNHDGLLFNDAPEEEGIKTLQLVNEMVDDLSELNKSKKDNCPPEVLEKTWHENMIWYGPAGIGASYTIPRYQKQHQIPFRKNLRDKVFHGHICRFAEGNFACFFGWPNLSNKPTGGFLGLPGGDIKADMQVVDVYCRKGNKLSENWVLIDLPYWLKQQGLDILKRTKTIFNYN